MQNCRLSVKAPVRMMQLSPSIGEIKHRSESTLFLQRTAKVAYVQHDPNRKCHETIWVLDFSWLQVSESQER